MTLTTRTVTNAGAPLCKPDGTVLAGVGIRFTLIHATSRFRADAWDAVSNERVGCIDITVETDNNGEFEVDLWPTSRANVAVLYLCHVDYEGFRDFQAPLDAGGTDLPWVELMAGGEAITPQGLSALQQHIDDATAAHAASAISVAEILGLDASNVQDALEALAAATGIEPPTAAEVTFTPAGGIAATDVQAAIEELDAEKQPKDPTLTAFAGLTTAADKLPYATGVDTFSTTDFTAAARTFAAQATAADQRTALGLGTVATLASDVDTTLAADSDLRVPTQKAVKTHVAAAVASLVASAPTTLDTLDELAAALGDDPNFATTLTTLIGQKLAKASNLSDLTSADTALTNLGLSANGKSLVTAANYAAMRTLLSLDTLYQALLVSGTNIKTINGNSLLGSGDIALSASPAGSDGQAQYNASGVFGALNLFRVDANTLAMRNGATAQAFHLYRSYTDASNWERLTFDVSSGALRISEEAAGTGDNNRGLILRNSGSDILRFQYSGAYVAGNAFGPWSSSNSYLGGNGANSGNGWLSITMAKQTAGSPGAATIDRSLGRVTIGAGNSSVVVTSDKVAASSSVFAVVSQNDTTAKIKNVVPGAGSFTINLESNATADTTVDFFVVMSGS